MLRKIKHTLGLVIYRTCELCNGEIYKSFRVIPYKYIERIKWKCLLYLIDIGD